MNLGVIRVRLTLWYLAILALGLAALGVGSWFAIRASVFHAVDGGLEDRTKGVQKFMNEQLASLSLGEIRDEFREHSVLGPGGDLFQVCNQRGEWLYRSAPLENNRVAIRLPRDLASPVYENLTVQGVPVRIVSSRIEANRDRLDDPPMDQKPSTPIPLFASSLEACAGPDGPPMDQKLDSAALSGSVVREFLKS